MKDRYLEVTFRKGKPVAAYVQAFFSNTFEQTELISY